MARYIVRRLLQGVVVVFVVLTLIFVLSRVSGDPTYLMLPMEATQEDVEALRHDLGLDKPTLVQYGIFMSNAVKGDFGKSIRSRKSAMGIVFKALPNSLKLGAFALVVTFLFAIPLGVIAAVRKNSAVDNLAKVIAALGQGLPMFFLGIVAIEIFAVRAGWLPTSGLGGIDHYVLPGFTMGLFVMAGVMRLVRSGMLDVLDSEFVKMARIKGVPEPAIYWKHALKNAMIPVLTFAGVYFAALVTSAVIIETIFNWPGIGSLLYNGFTSRDYPMVQAAIFVVATIVVMVNLIVDVLYAYVDPRIRYG